MLLILKNYIDINVETFISLILTCKEFQHYLLLVSTWSSTRLVSVVSGNFYPGAESVFLTDVI